MNKRISTRSGFLTALSILFYELLLVKMQVDAQSSWHFLQFLFLFIGVLISMAFLYHHYTDIRFVEGFSHGMKTTASTLIVLILGNILLYYFLNRPKASLSGVNWMIMKTLFAYGFSGILSSLMATAIFNTFTKK